MASRPQRFFALSGNADYTDLRSLYGKEAAASGPKGSGQYGSAGGPGKPATFDPMLMDPAYGYPGSGGGAPGGSSGGGGGAALGGGGGEQFLGGGGSASHDPSNIGGDGPGATLGKGSVYDPEGNLLGINAGTGSEYGGGAEYSGQSTPGSFADAQRAIDSRRRGAAPFDWDALEAGFSNAFNTVTAPITTGIKSLAELAGGVPPGAWGGIQNIPGYTALPEFQGPPTMAQYQQMVQQAVGSPWAGSQGGDDRAADRARMNQSLQLGNLYGRDVTSLIGPGAGYGGGRGGNAGGGYGAHGGMTGSGDRAGQQSGGGKRVV